MSGEQAKITRTRRETRRYERSVDIELGMMPRQTRAEALTVVVQQRLGDLERYETREPVVTLTLKRTTKAGEPTYKGDRQVTISEARVRDRWSSGIWQFDDDTVARLLALREQVLVEFGTIDWEDARP